MPDHVVAVDGGNSKTDVVVASTTGRVLARARGPGVVSPLGDPAGWRDGLAALVTSAQRAAGVRGTAACAAYFLANVDLPAEFRIARRELARAGLAEVTVVRNDGTIAGLPDEAVVEVPALVDTAGPHPVPVSPLPPEMLGLVQAVTAYEVLAIEAARTGSPDTALRALVANPLVRQWHLAVPLLDALLEANRAHLPRFFPDG